MKHSLVILVVADSSKIIDEHTRKFVITMPIGLSNEDERNRIIEYCLKTFNLTGNNKEEEQAITRLTSGLDIHQIESILRESWYLNKKFDPVTVKIAKTELVKGTGVLEIVYPGYGFEAVGGYNSVKTFVKENIISVLQDTQRAEILGVPTPRGILFFGPPRTGKTLFSKSLAKELSIPFLNFNTEDIFSKWLGESGQKMKQAIRIVNQMGLCILYIDEIDRFGKRSSASADGASEETRRVFSQLLEWLGDKERKAMIIGTTNVPKDLDPAFLGCGRFDYKIPFLYPGKEARNQILRIHLGLEESGTKKPPPIELGARALNSLLDDIVEKTKYFNGAELEELTNRIRRNALNRRNSKSLIKEDFEEALRHFQVDKIKRIEEMKGYLEDSKSLTDDPIFLEEFQEVNQ
jgi:SpoVK/Ycf46/Vps4 family AAA+-type ATPase